jgi:hypothetical protein
MKLKARNKMAINTNNMEKAQELVGKLDSKKVKYIKKDKGLIERNTVKDEQVILTEDNRQILLG